MKALIHRGTHEIGGTLIELTSGESRILLNVGFRCSSAASRDTPTGISLTNLSRNRGKFDRMTFSS